MDLKDPNFDVKKERNPTHKQWVVGVSEGGRVFIQDDNFEYDARLYIDGDFYDQELEVKYANKIAEVLNAISTVSNSEA